MLKVYRFLYCNAYLRRRDKKNKKRGISRVRKEKTTIFENGIEYVKYSLLFSFVFLVFCFFFTRSVFSENHIPNPDAESNSIIPRTAQVESRIHTKKITSLIEGVSEEEKASTIHKYLAGLDTRELIETAAEMAADNQLETSVVILVPYIKKRWATSVPVAEVCEMVSNKMYDAKLRAFLIDITTKIKNLSDAETLRIEATILVVAQDEKSDIGLRRYALLQLRKPNSSQHVTRGSESELMRIFTNTETPPEVKGAAITAMRRTKDPALESVIDTVLKAKEDFPTIVVRHAVVASAKSGLSKKYIEELKKITNTTVDPELYASTIYSLGITGGQDAIAAIVADYGRHGNERIGWMALRQNEKTILSMIELSQPIEIINIGIEAARLGEIVTSVSQLQAIAAKHPEKTLRDKATEVLKVLESLGNTDTHSRPNKWEYR